MNHTSRYIKIITKKTYLRFASFFCTPRKFESYYQDYLEIDGCKDVDLKDQYLKGNLVKLKKPLATYCNELLNIINDKVKRKKAYTVIRASDGEAYFLQKKAIGNVTSRHFTAGQSLETIDVSQFKSGLLSCNLRLQEMNRKNRWMFKKIYKKNIFSEIPFEALYAIMANRQIYKNSYKIGLIGSEKKLDIIQNLFKSAKYRDYIGRDGFQDYIGIPEKGAANDPARLAASISDHMRDKDIDIYLIGIGIAKMAVMPIISKSTTAVLIDAGAGISALAGFAGYERQYFANWKNFKLKDYNYNEIDIMDSDDDRIETIII